MISVDIPFGFLAFTNAKKQEKLACRYGSIFSALQLHAYIVYYFTAALKPFYYGIDRKLGIVYIFMHFLSFFLWYSVNRQERRIRRLVHMQESLLPHRRAHRAVATRDWCILAFFTLFPIVCGGINVYLVLFRDVDMSFYSFGYLIQNSFLNFLVMFIGSYGYCLVCGKWPGMALWSLCHTLNEGANILHIYDKRVKLCFPSRLLTKRNMPLEEGVNRIKEYTHASNIRSFRDNPSKRFRIESISNSSLISDGVSTESTLYRVRAFSSDGVNMDEDKNSTRSLKFDSSKPLKEILIEYFEILKMIRVLRDIVSLPSFFLTMSSFLYLYSIIGLILFRVISSGTIWYEELTNCFAGCSIIVSLGYYGAKIPQRMQEIRTTCSDIINAIEIDEILDSKELTLLKRVENVDLVHISACGFVVFSRSFIVASFGSILTFGLLIFNLK